MGAPSASERSSGLYARVMGSSWLQVAEPVRLAHATTSTVRAHGRLRIAHGGGRAARAVAWLLRLPRANEAADTRLVVTPASDGEQWLRTFDGRCLDTRQYHACEGELAERVGCLEFRFHLDVFDGSILFRQVGAAFVVGPIRVRLPSVWAPRVDAREEPAGACQTRIHVLVDVPPLGTLLTYDGTMDFEDARA